MVLAHRSDEERAGCLHRLPMHLHQTAENRGCSVEARKSRLPQDCVVAREVDAQHDAAQAYIRSQAYAGWSPIRSRYDDGSYSGGSHAALSAELNSCGRNAATFTVS